MGRVGFLVRDRAFACVSFKIGDHIPQATRAFRAIVNCKSEFTEFADARALACLSQQDFEVSEQTRVGEDGNSVPLLHAVLPDEDSDNDANLDMKSTLFTIKKFPVFSLREFRLK
jgi:hypothetical protein